MRILHFFKTYWPDTFGGVERSINAIAETTASGGAVHQILALSNNPHDDPLHFNGQTVHQAKRHLAISSTDISFNCLGTLKHLAAESDLIHLHFPWPFMDMMYFMANTGKPTIVTYHADALANPVLEACYAPLRNRFLSSVDAIVPTSENYLASSAVLPRFIDKTRVIPLGLDPASYPQASQSRMQLWQQRLGNRFFLFVGVLRHYKGLNILLEAAGQTAANFVIAGAGPSEAELISTKQRLGLDNVHFVGSIDEEDKIALLSLCAGFIFPSNKRSEAYGLSLMEAAMMGKPMISCEIGTGTSFVNLNNVTGLVVPPNDPRALAHAVNRLDGDASLRHQFGSAARMRFDAELQATTMGDRYLDLYREVLGETAH